jgi:lysozyme
MRAAQNARMISYSSDIIARAIAQASGISRAPGEEGLVLHAYPDPATGRDPWTIGFGSTRMLDFTTGVRRPVRTGDVVSAAEAEMMLEADLRESLQTVLDTTFVMLNGDQLGALTSFTNNVGRGEKGVKDGLVCLRSGAPSTLLQMVNARMFEQAAGQFGLWDLAAGRVMGGLVRRRAIERDVFLSKLDMTGAVVPAWWRP